MALNALLLSEDPAVLQVLRPLLPEIGLETDQCSSAENARKLLTNRKYEAIIVDADLTGAFEFMASLRQLPMTRNAIIFSMTSSTSMTAAFQAGANFVLEKPLSSERALRSFRAAHGLILRERRRYYRHPVSTPAILEYGIKTEAVMLTNLSEGGMAIEVDSPLIAGQMLKWKFDLPGTKTSLEGKGEVSWTDDTGHAGVRFVHVPQAFKVVLEEWLTQRTREDPRTLITRANRGWKSET
jgi:CheY-like chemotaxis protein